jgi:hypothetical protein
MFEIQLSFDYAKTITTKNTVFGNHVHQRNPIQVKSKIELTYLRSIASS